MEIIANNTPNLMTDTNVHIQKTQLTLSRKNSKTQSILMVAREKWVVMYKGSLTRLTGNVSSETTRRKTYLTYWKEKTINQELYIWQNYPPTTSMKLRHSQTIESEGTVDSRLATRNARESPWGWNERVLDRPQSCTGTRTQEGELIGRQQGQHECLVCTSSVCLLKI